VTSRVLLGGSFSCFVACFGRRAATFAPNGALIKYNWIAKSIVAISTTLGYFSGDVTVRLMALSDKLGLDSIHAVLRPGH
jgi:hypothetical protein